MLPLEVIKKYYPSVFKEELREIQEIVYLLGYTVMQYFYGPNWEKDSDGWDFENKEG